MTTTANAAPAPALELHGIDTPLPAIGPEELARSYQKGQESVFEAVSDFIDTLDAATRDPRLDQMRERLAVTIGAGEPTSRVTKPAVALAQAADPLAALQEPLDAIREDFDSLAQQLAVGHDFVIRAAPLALLEPEAVELHYQGNNEGLGYLVCAVNAVVETGHGTVSAHISRCLDETDNLYLSVEARDATEADTMLPDRKKLRWSVECELPSREATAFARVLAQAVGRARDTGVVPE